MKLVPAEVVNQTEEMGKERGSETTPADTVMVVVVCGFKAALQLNSRRERGREREGTGQQKKHKLNSRGGRCGGSVTWKILCRNSWEEKEGEGDEGGREGRGEYHKILN